MTRTTLGTVMLLLGLSPAAGPAAPMELEGLEIRRNAWLTADGLAPQGTLYQATVPDTLDLAERAREAVFGLTSFLDARHHYSGFGHGLFAVNPPCLVHDQGRDQNWGKVMEALALARAMSGSTVNLDREAAALDGMINYALLKKDEPYPVPLARMLMALEALHRYRPHPELPPLIACYRAWLTNQIRVDAPARQGYFGKPEDRWARNDEDALMGVTGYGHQVYTAGNVLRGLIRADGVAGANWDAQFPHFLRNSLLDARFWTPEGHAPLVVPAQHGQFAGHHHSYTQGLLGLLYLAARERDARTLEFVRQSYEHLRTFGLARVGLYGEGCTTGDMTYLAVRLSQWGVGDYWEDVDQYVRNHLTELQILDTARLETVVREKARPLVPAELEDWAQGVDTNNVVARCRGLFWSDSTHPALIPLREQAGPHSSCLQWVVCCSGNCTKALHEVWSGMLEWDATSRFARVHLLLNRASPALDVESYLPHEGKVLLRLKQTCRLAVRLPGWVDKSAVECAVGSTPLSCSWLGNYLVLPEVRRGQDVALRFSMRETTEEYLLPWPMDQFYLESTQPPAAWRGAKPTRFILTFRGNTLADIQPRDTRAGFALYSDRSLERLRAPAPLKRRARFVPSKP